MFYFAGLMTGVSLFSAIALLSMWLPVRLARKERKSKGLHTTDINLIFAFVGTVVFIVVALILTVLAFVFN